MTTCDICGNGRASRTLSGIGVCEKCFDGVIHDIRTGNKSVLEYYSDYKNLPGASQKGLEYIDAQLATYKEKEHASSAVKAAQADEQKRVLLAKEKASKILLSTTPSIDGYKVVKYIDIISEEVLFNTGLLNKFVNSVSDLVDSLTVFSEKELSGSTDVLKRSKDYVKEKLKFEAAYLGANAVIGVDMETSFGTGSTSAVRVSINGTAVKLAKIENI